MLDASGRVPQAITQGNRVEMGNYDQCLNIHEELETGTVINGRYCYSGLAIPINVTDSNSLSSLSLYEVVCEYMDFKTCT